MDLSLNDLPLRRLCFSQASLREGIKRQIIAEVASDLSNLSTPSGKKDLVKLANNLVPFLNDPTFSSIWVALFDRLSSFAIDEEITSVFNSANQKQAELFEEKNNKTIPVSVLHRLWLAHLPCLEFTILTIIKHISTSKYCFPARIRDVLNKSFIAEVSSREPLIYQTVYRMISSISLQSDYPDILVDLLAMFCRASRQRAVGTPYQDQVHILRRPGKSAVFKSLLSTTPQSSSQPSVCHCLYELQKEWTKLMEHPEVLDDRHVQNTPPHNATVSEKCDFHDDLIDLTIEYREWVSAALDNVLICEQKYIKSCLWLILLHNKVKFNAPPYIEMEQTLLKYVYNLRSLIQVHCISMEQQKVIIAPVKTNQLSGCSHNVHDEFLGVVTVQIFVMFLFHSTSGFSAGWQICLSVRQLEMVTKYLIYHYQNLEVNPNLWKDTKRKAFRVFLNDLISRLNSEETVISAHFKSPQDEMYKILATL
ncbi:unnamed protein product [Lymnaea stagnalis]|uniref:Uncharacterized protein n=1 Tax=Lymnaea stagnalis TaxID=6523 RepID=A0AAV2IJH8_LYMST